jgi:DHA1 family tetracycline resistance protein-like MFS transporter
MAAAGLTLLNAIYGLLVLPESLRPEHRTSAFAFRRANPIGSLSLLRSHHELLPLAMVSFMNQLSQMVWPSVFVLYTGYRYGWTPMFTGFYMAAGSLLGIGVQSFLVGPAVQRFGERGALAIGATAAICGFTWYGLAPTGLLYMCGMPVGCLTGLLIPGLQGLMTRRVGPTEQGQLQGANQSLIGIAAMLGPVIFGLSFAQAVRHPAWGVPGLPMLLAAAIMAGCLTLAIWAGRRASGPPPLQEGDRA